MRVPAMPLTTGPLCMPIRICTGPPFIGIWTSRAADSMAWEGRGKGREIEMKAGEIRLSMGAQGRGGQWLVDGALRPCSPWPAPHDLQAESRCCASVAASGAES